MNISIQNQYKVQEPLSLIEELTDELLENIIDRLDWKSLSECSKTSKRFRKFIWLNHRYMLKLFNEKFISEAFKCIEELSKDEQDKQLLKIIPAYAKTDPDTAITCLDRIQNPEKKVTVLLKIIPNIVQIQAKQQLLVAIKLSEDSRLKCSHRCSIVEELSSIDLAAAIEVYQQIEAPFYKLHALIVIAKRQSFKERCETVNRYIEKSKLAKEGPVFLEGCLEIMSPVQLKSLYIGEMAFIEDEPSAYHAGGMMRVMATIETELSISKALAYKRQECIISMLCVIAIELSPVNLQRANEVIEMAKERASNHHEFAEIACAVRKWDKIEAEKICLTAIAKFKISCRQYSFIGHVFELFTSFPAIGLEHIDLILDVRDRMFTLITIGMNMQSQEIYEKGVLELMAFDNEVYPHSDLHMKQAISFGEEFAVKIARGFNETKYKAAKLLNLANLLMKKNPRMAVNLVKEGMTVIEQIKDPKDKINCYLALQGDASFI